MTLTSQSRRQIARILKLMIAIVFLGLGGWCVFMPEMVERLSIKAEFRHLSETSKMFLQCFGAQAMLVGTLVMVSKFTARTFLVFGLVCSIPFFIFNYWFVFVAEMFTSWMLLDFLGNLIFLLTGLSGWYLMKSEIDPV